MISDEKKIRKGLKGKINKKKTSLSDYYEVVGKKCSGRVRTHMMGLQDCLVARGPFCRLFMFGCGEHIELFMAN